MTITERFTSRQYTRAILTLGKYNLRPEHWAALNDYAEQLAARWLRMFGAVA